MKVDLHGLSVLLRSAPGDMPEVLAAVLTANGASVALMKASEGLSGATPDRLVVMHELRPDQQAENDDPLKQILAFGNAMRERGSGRIVHIFGVWGVLPMRRYLKASVRAAALVAGLRGAAMSLAPQVLVNGIAVGAVLGETNKDLIAGDPAMPGHSALSRAGRIADVAGALLFLVDPSNTYMTGQIIAVDGGWNIGYARNF
jgi:NAD(P)-dependent dehydrogenase (short-subunit alcohol dehydrogenase family)